MAYNPPIGSIYHLYTTYILPSGWLYGTYHLLGAPETTIEDSTPNKKGTELRTQIPRPARIKESKKTSGGLNPYRIPLKANETGPTFSSWWFQPL